MTPSISTVTASSKSTGRYQVATYYRISLDDGTHNETLSITNQRNLVTDYLSRHEELSTASVTEYIDDGISGSTLERQAYQQLMTAIDHGEVDCIVVKDLSRIGSNLIDVNDLLMNHLVTLNIRFIAINNGYDSLSSPLSNLELSVINLANQHYNRDLAQKLITARHAKVKRGEYLGTFAPFGYQKSTVEKNKLIPDEEAANHVKLIFSLACEGASVVEIAKTLNSHGVPSPSMYKKQRGIVQGWYNAVDPDYCFWNGASVYKVLKNEVYIGTVAYSKSKVLAPGSKQVSVRPREDWITSPNAHEPLVSKADFDKVQLLFSRTQNRQTFEKIFIRKVKCAKCGHTMVYQKTANPRFRCGTAKVTDHYDCQSFHLMQEKLEAILLPAIQLQLTVLVDQEAIKLARLSQSKTTAKSLATKFTTEQRGIETLETSITKWFTSLAMGKIDEGIFTQKKAAINDTIARKKVSIQKWSDQLQALTDETKQAEDNLAVLSHFRSLEKLDKNVIDLLVDKILVHDEHDVEIVWLGTFEN